MTAKETQLQQTVLIPFRTFPRLTEYNITKIAGMVDESFALAREENGVDSGNRTATINLNKVGVEVLFTEEIILADDN